MKGESKAKLAKTSYMYDSRLEAFLAERLHLEKVAKNNSAASEFGQKFANSSRRKTYIMNEIVFPSMANVVYFLEFVAKHEALWDAFEFDMKELLGMKFPDDYDFRDFEFDIHADKHYLTVFERLLLSILTWDGFNDKKNFRLLVMHLALSIISLRVRHFVGHDLTTATGKIMTDDIDRANAWLGLLASRVTLDTDIPHRKIQF